MKILIAPDKFKGSLTAAQVCVAIKTGILAVKPNAEIVELPLADGGEGFSEAIVGANHSKKIEITINDPLGRWKTTSYFLLENNTAIIEMANASGLKLLYIAERNPLKTSTLGTGELIRNAIEKGAKEIIVGIGGSATNDAGMGMAEALGYKFFDKNGDRLRPIGENLIKVFSMTAPLQKPWEKVKIKVACDVENTLYGSSGAAYLFAPQKGANSQQVKDLDEGLRSFSRVINKHFGQNFHFVAGTGAAGGLGYGLMAFLGAELKSGIDLILEANRFDEKLNGVDLVITGEGKIDNQTLQGKVVVGVAKNALKHKISVVAFCGKNELNQNQLEEFGVSKIFELIDSKITEKYAIGHANEILIAKTKLMIEEYLKKNNQ